jgi:hypothetical protein
MNSKLRSAFLLVGLYSLILGLKTPSAAATTLEEASGIARGEVSESRSRLSSLPHGFQMAAQSPAVGCMNLQTVEAAVYTPDLATQAAQMEASKKELIAAGFYILDAHAYLKQSREYASYNTYTIRYYSLWDPIVCSGVPQSLESVVLYPDVKTAADELAAITKTLSDTGYRVIDARTYEDSYFTGKFRYNIRYVYPALKETAGI